MYINKNESGNSSASAAVMKEGHACGLGVHTCAIDLTIKLRTYLHIHVF